MRVYVFSFCLSIFIFICHNFTSHSSSETGSLVIWMVFRTSSVYTNKYHHFKWTNSQVFHMICTVICFVFPELNTPYMFGHFCRQAKPRICTTYLFRCLRYTTNNIVHGWQIGGWAGQFRWNTVWCKRRYVGWWCNWTQLWCCCNAQKKSNIIFIVISCLRLQSRLNMLKWQLL